MDCSTLFDTSKDEFMTKMPKMRKTWNEKGMEWFSPFLLEARYRMDVIDGNSGDYFTGLRSLIVSIGLPTSPRRALTCSGFTAPALLPKLLRM